MESSKYKECDKCGLAGARTWRLVNEELEEMVANLCLTCAIKMVGDYEFEEIEAESLFDDGS